MPVPRPVTIATAIAIAVVGCKRKPDGASSGGSAPAADAPNPPPADAGNAIGGCERDESFAETVEVLEASGATLLPGGEEILVVGDSGSNGEYAVIRARDGGEVRRGELPLDDHASDDLEGLSYQDGELVALTSSGWFRHWSFAGDSEPALTRPAYAGSASAELLCSSARRSNCGMNYEGLCLSPSPAADGSCVGAAVAKATGELYCVRRTAEGQLSIDAAVSTRVARPEVLSGCHVAADGAIWVGANLLAGNQVYRVEGFGGPGAAVATVAAIGVGFGEAIAVDEGGAVYRFSDTANRPSLTARFECKRPEN